jgi:hypothetical protein
MTLSIGAQLARIRQEWPAYLLVAFLALSLADQIARPFSYTWLAAILVLSAMAVALVSVAEDLTCMIDLAIGRVWDSLLTRTEEYPLAHRRVRQLMGLYVWLRPALTILAVALLATVYFATKAGYYHWIASDQATYEQAGRRLVATMVFGAIACFVCLPIWLWARHRHD